MEGVGFALIFNLFSEDFDKKMFLHFRIKESYKGPMPDGSLSWIQEQRLKDLGYWMDINREGIHGTRPFLPNGAIPTGNFRYTSNKDQMGLYIFVLDWHKHNFDSKMISVPMNIKGFVS